MSLLSGITSRRTLKKKHPFDFEFEDANLNVRLRALVEAFAMTACLALHDKSVYKREKNRIEHAANKQMKEIQKKRLKQKLRATDDNSSVSSLGVQNIQANVEDEANPE